MLFRSIVKTDGQCGSIGDLFDTSESFALRGLHDQGIHEDCTMLPLFQGPVSSLQLLDLVLQSCLPCMALQLSHTSCCLLEYTRTQ